MAGQGFGSGHDFSRAANGPKEEKVALAPARNAIAAAIREGFVWSYRSRAVYRGTTSVVPQEGKKEIGALAPGVRAGPECPAEKESRCLVCMK